MVKHHVLWLGLMTLGACTGGSSTAHGPVTLPPVDDLAAPADLDLRVLSPQAQRGLTLSPVPIDTTNMPFDQKESVGMGAYLVAALNCGNCHGAATGAFLSGGRAFGTVTNPIYARNLTPDPTTGLKLTEAQFIEANRTNKDFVDNGALQTHPFATYRWMTNYDLQSIYAYLKVIPPVKNQVMPDMKATPGTPTPSPVSYSDGDVTRTLPPDGQSDPLGAQRGLALQPLDNPSGFSFFTDSAKRSFGRGSYLVTLLGCNNCHTNPSLVGAKINTSAFLSGGRVFITAAAMAPVVRTVRVMSANLTGQQRGLQMTADQFVQTLINQKHADEPSMRTLAAPMPSYKNLVDEDLQALYTYLIAVPRRTAAADKATQEYARYCATSADCNVAAGETCNAATTECVGKTCAVDADCDACQTCSAGKLCIAPASGSACLTSGL